MGVLGGEVGPEEVLPAHSPPHCAPRWPDAGTPVAAHMQIQPGEDSVASQLGLHC